MNHQILGGWDFTVMTVFPPSYSRILSEWPVHLRCACVDSVKQSSTARGFIMQKRWTVLSFSLEHAVIYNTM